MPTTMPRKIAFIRRGSFSHINAIVGEMLRKHFPEHEVEITDVDEILKRNKGMRLCYLLHIFKIYGWRSLASSMKFPEKLPA
ncbi:MAG: hypothetical protein JWQ71_3151 [Pedosphaera sp.]|nr:hypothetical protein [Pedosphaera sp.]